MAASYRVPLLREVPDDALDVAGWHVAVHGGAACGLEQHPPQRALGQMRATTARRAMTIRATGRRRRASTFASILAGISDTRGALLEPSFGCGVGRAG